MKKRLSKFNNNEIDVAYARLTIGVPNSGGRHCVFRHFLVC